MYVLRYAPLEVQADLNMKYKTFIFEILTIIEQDCVFLTSST